MALPTKEQPIMLRRQTLRVLVALGSALMLTVSLSTAALADKRDFNINNNSDYVIQHAYVSAAFDPEWGDDILGKDVLNPGEIWQVGFDRGDANTCVWDVKVVTVEGFEVKLPQLDLCRITDVNINN
jgi:hypothetical protein